MTSPWVDGELVNAAVMYARTTQRINQLADGAGVGWTATTPASGITSTVMVNKVGTVVSVRGLIQPGTSFAANSSYGAVVTFPVGFRPSPSGVTIYKIAGGNSPNAIVRLALQSSGAVDMLTGSTAPTSIDASVLSGFLAETT